MRIIDAHVHLGDGPHKAYTLETLQDDLADACATGAVVFAFPEDMYRIVDTHESRVAANAYVLEASRRASAMYPFYFVWNDYFIADDFDEFVGIKWHRHADEPRYDYTQPGCEAMLERIRARNVPVILEEELGNTIAFIDRNPDLPVIIPHCGQLNGGTPDMERFFDNPNVYFGTSMALPANLAFVAEHVPPTRIIFGSDVSGTSQPFFNFTAVELEKVRKMQFTADEFALVLAGNIDRILSAVVN